MMNIIRPSLMSRHYKTLCVGGVSLQGQLMFALSFPGLDLECVFTYLSRLHARVMSFCQSSVVRLHGYSTLIHRVGTILLFVVVAAFKLT